MTKNEIALKILTGLLANSEIAKEIIKGEVQKIKFLEKNGIAPEHIKRQNNGEATQKWFVDVAFQFAEKFIEGVQEDLKNSHESNKKIIAKWAAAHKKEHQENLKKKVARENKKILKAHSKKPVINLPEIKNPKPRKG